MEQPRTRWSGNRRPHDALDVNAIGSQARWCEHDCRSQLPIPLSGGLNPSVSERSTAPRQSRAQLLFDGVGHTVLVGHEAERNLFIACVPRSFLVLLPLRLALLPLRLALLPLRLALLPLRLALLPLRLALMGRLLARRGSPQTVRSAALR
jgi:hypothetical protein